MSVFCFQSLPPLSLYIHIPWCIRKCPYCDFNSHAVKDGVPEAAYVDALLQDLEQELPGIWGRSIDTLFLGGGTPSLFSPQAIDRLLCGIRARAAVRPDPEITLEANPGTLEQGKFKAYRAAGVNRLSIGVQSFAADKLQALGRIHSDREAHDAIESAYEAGFDNVNIDLMFGLPGQTTAEALTDLQTAIDKQPSHLSWYQLTLEPNTAFYHTPPALPDSERLWEIQHAGQGLLAEYGYTHYEVSAYSRNGRHCRHNLNYWQFGDYIGIGAGAHGKISDAASQQIRRTHKPRHPRGYLAVSGGPGARAAMRTLDSAAVVFEFALNRLRLKRGFTGSDFSKVTGLPYSAIEKRVASAIDEGLLMMNRQQIIHTERGWNFLDELVSRFLPEVN